MTVTEEDGVMVKLGRAAATIQAFPRKGFNASKDNLRFLKSVYRMSFMRRAKKTGNGETHE